MSKWTHDWGSLTAAQRAFYRHKANWEHMSVMAIMREWPVTDREAREAFDYTTCDRCGAKLNALRAVFVDVDGKSAIYGSYCAEKLGLRPSGSGEATHEG